MIEVLRWRRERWCSRRWRWFEQWEQWCDPRTKPGVQWRIVSRLRGRGGSLWWARARGRRAPAELSCPSEWSATILWSERKNISMFSCQIIFLYLHKLRVEIPQVQQTRRKMRRSSTFSLMNSVQYQCSSQHLYNTPSSLSATMNWWICLVFDNRKCYVMVRIEVVDMSHQWLRW